MIQWYARLPKSLFLCVGSGILKVTEPCSPRHCEESHHNWTLTLWIVRCLRDQAGDDGSPQAGGLLAPSVNEGTLVVWRKYSSASLERHCPRTYIWTLEHITRCVTDIHARTFEGKRPALWRFVRVHANTTHPMIKMEKETVPPHRSIVYHWGARKTWRRQWDCGEAEREGCSFLCGKDSGQGGIWSPRFSWKGD